MSKCRSCQAKIRWVKMEPNGKPMPVDDEPSEKGNIALVGGKGHVLLAGAIAMYTGPLFLSHYASCPDAKDWRKPRE